MIKKFGPFLLLIFLIVPSFYQLIRPGFFPMQDDLQAFRLNQMNKCFQDLQIPCRWIPDAGFGYGYPLFNFYSPGVYYLGEIFHLLGLQFIDMVKILFILGFLLATFAMFIFIREIFGILPAYVAAVLYNFTPFRATEVYVRGALSEFFAQIFFPLIFWSSYKLIRTNQLKYLLWFSLSVGLLLIFHNLMSFIFLPIGLIWIVTLVVLEKKYQLIPKIIGGLFLGVGLSAFFTLPAFFERGYVHLETLLGGYFDYRQHFVSLYQLFISNHFGYGSSFLGPNDDLSLSVGIPHWILALGGLGLAIFNYKKQKNISIIFLVISLVTLVAIFLMHQRSHLIWENINWLHFLQFPWRFLAVSGFLLSFLAGGTLYLISQKLNPRLIKLLSSSIIIAVLIIYGIFFQPKDWINISDQEKFSGESWQKQLTISIFDYLPIFAKFPPKGEAPNFPEVLEGQVEFRNYQKGSNFQKGEAVVLEDAKMRLPLFDFPGMQVKVDEKVVPHINNDCRGEEFCLGLISFNMDQGMHNFEAKLTETPIRQMANLLSLISLLVLVFLIFGKKYVKTF